jgi:hypothetical protein
MEDIYNLQAAPTVVANINCALVNISLLNNNIIGPTSFFTSFTPGQVQTPLVNRLRGMY